MDSVPPGLLVIHGFPDNPGDQGSILLSVLQAGYLRGQSLDTYRKPGIPHHHGISLFLQAGWSSTDSRTIQVIRDPSCSLSRLVTYVASPWTSIGNQESRTVMASLCCSSLSMDSRPIQVIRAGTDWCGMDWQQPVAEWVVGTSLSTNSHCTRRPGHALHSALLGLPAAARINELLALWRDTTVRSRQTFLSERVINYLPYDIVCFNSLNALNGVSNVLNKNSFEIS